MKMKVMLQTIMVLGLLCGVSSADIVLMLDTFDTTTEVDVNTELGTPRQTGTLVPAGGISYTKLTKNNGTLGVWNCYAGNAPNEPELILYRNNNATVHSLWQDQNESTLVGANYKAGVHMDFDSTSASWGFLAVAESQDNCSGYLPATGVIVNIDPSGAWELYLGGISHSVASGTVTGALAYDVTLAIDETGASTAVTLLIDGNTVGSGSFAWTSGDRYLGIGGNMGGTRSSMWFNDLSLTEVPEPATLSLLAVGGVFTLLRRKR